MASKLFGGRSNCCSRLTFRLFRVVARLAGGGREHVTAKRYLRLLDGCQESPIAILKKDTVLHCRQRQFEEYKLYLCEQAKFLQNCVAFRKTCCVDVSFSKLFMSKRRSAVHCYFQTVLIHNSRSSPRRKA